jgi:hypothetical protein
VFREPEIAPETPSLAVPLCRWRVLIALGRFSFARILRKIGSEDPNAGRRTVPDLPRNYVRPSRKMFAVSTADYLIPSLREPACELLERDVVGPNGEEVKMRSTSSLELPFPKTPHRLAIGIPIALSQ